MSDDKPVPETLETIAEKIGALGKSIEARFEQVDKRFEQVDKRFEQVDTRFEQIDRRFEQVDTRFDELKAQLRTEIETVDARVKLVYEVVVAQTAKNTTIDAEHATLHRRLDNHDVRILALERRRRTRG
jgi:predicted transcriptional regulator